MTIPIFKFIPMLFSQQAGRQRLDRTPEPDSLTNSAENVQQYDRVLQTKLVIAYALGLEIVHRSCSGANGGCAVDLACGPGHYTLSLARYLSFDRIEGIDLAPRMIEIASQNAARLELQKRVGFRIGDITQLHVIESATMALASFTDAAHHMPDIQSVHRVFREMDRITKPDGLVMIMDLVRLRTSKLTERYVKTLGYDYVARGLPQFFDDFRNSMYAAWTASELYQAIPTDSRRFWIHLVPRGLPTIQIILGLPVGRKKVFVRSGFPWPKDQNPVPKKMLGEWRMLRWSLAFGSRRVVPAINPHLSSTK